MKALEPHTNQKRIEELTLKEVDMIYSLSRVGEWTELEIGRRYGISRADVRTVVDRYEQLREAAQKNHHPERLPQEPSSEITMKERKRRCDARYSTTAERQAAYRARLKEKPSASLEQRSRGNDTDSSAADSELIDIGLPAPVTETDPDCPDTKLLT